METQEKTTVTITTTVKARISKVWECWTEPKHITKWCQASDDWHAPKATNDLQTGGKFSTTMAAKDGSASFDFGGVYTKVDKHKTINYKMDDDRKVHITFEEKAGETKVTESFETESQNSVEMQRSGWQAILDNFKNYCEKN
jgi:uncharacterized protein YndB with AHSA1/START domain